jgi:hypothetical protein
VSMYGLPRNFALSYDRFKLSWFFLFYNPAFISFVPKKYGGNKRSTLTGSARIVKKSDGCDVSTRKRFAAK